MLAYPLAYVALATHTYFQPPKIRMTYGNICTQITYATAVGTIGITEQTCRTGQLSTAI